MEFSFLLISSQCGNIVQKISFETKKSDRQSRHKMKLRKSQNLILHIRGMRKKVEARMSSVLTLLFNYLSEYRDNCSAICIILQARAAAGRVDGGDFIASLAGCLEHSKLCKGAMRENVENGENRRTSELRHIRQCRLHQVHNHSRDEI